MDKDRQKPTNETSLPAYAMLSINRCNLPAVILGSLTFQHHPVSLGLDGVNEMHQLLFRDLHRIVDKETRAIHFMDYMASCYLLDNPEQAGLSQHVDRKRNDYPGLLRGWHFDPDSQEAAALKGWVESRFGLLCRNHHGPIRYLESKYYLRFLSDRSKAIYNSNALESQLDLLYSFTQYELARRLPDEKHIILYRGINHLHCHEILKYINYKPARIILNNLSSFTSDKDRTDEFGDTVIECLVPLSKLLFIPGLLPVGLKGEEEYLVIGGVYGITQLWFVIEQ